MTRESIKKFREKLNLAENQQLKEEKLEKERKRLRDYRQRMRKYHPEILSKRKTKSINKYKTNKKLRENSSEEILSIQTGFVDKRSIVNS
jgi:uncharacterized LabA/DUF88 family protein